MKRSMVRWMLLSVVALTLTSASFAQIAVGISVRIGPPALPVYAQPICPGPGYVWTPGYWAWNDVGGYYWVPGTWVVAPVGMLWTPGYWGWGGGVYLWHPGYWGPHVGFYGGINYGFGYTGVGFVGGEWRHGGFYYNRSVTNVSVTNVTNVYNKTVIVNKTTINNVSYNGGTGGVVARPSVQEEGYAHEQHTAALSAQTQHERMASENHQNFASENRGRPTIAATARPGDFSGHSAIGARAAGGEYHAPAMSPREARVASNNNGNHPASGGGTRPNDGFRPFVPPAKNNASTQNRSNDRPNGNSSRGNEGNYDQNHYSESRPQNQPRESSPPRENSHPNQQHSSPPPQHHQAPPPKEDHRGR